MSAARILRRMLAPLRHTPLHPQWFVRERSAHIRQQLLRCHGRVLDIGCADKRFARLLPPDCEYIGLDYYATVKSIYHTRPDIFGDAATLPFATGSFDAVLLFEVLEHVVYPDATIAEISRILRPGGIVLLTVPFLYPIHDAPHDYHRFTRFALDRLLTDHDLIPQHIAPRLRSVEVAGLLQCLALGDAARAIVDRHRFALPLLPLIAIGIVIGNVAAWLLARLLPGSDFMPGGYEIAAKRV